MDLDDLVGKGMGSEEEDELRGSNSSRTVFDLDIPGADERFWTIGRNRKLQAGSRTPLDNARYLVDDSDR